MIAESSQNFLSGFSIGFRSEDCEIQYVHFLTYCLSPISINNFYNF